MEQYPESSNGIVQLVKFELDGKPNDFRMYVSRLVRKYRVSDAPFSKEPESLLHSTNAFKPVPIRDANREMHLTGKPPVLFNWWNCPSRISNGYVECANRLIKEADMRGAWLQLRDAARPHALPKEQPQADHWSPAASR